jgi:hypothetical protein
MQGHAGSAIPAAIAADLKNGLVSPESARDDDGAE